MLISGFGILALRLLLMCLNHGTHIRTTIAPLRISLRIPHHTTHCLYPLIVFRFNAGNKKVDATSAFLLPVVVKAIRSNATANAVFGFFVMR